MHSQPRLAACALALFAAPLPAQEAFQLKQLPSERYTVVQGGYFPRLAALPNGHLLAFFKTGAAHIGKSGKASMSRSTDSGKTWSNPETVFDLPDADDGVDANGLTRGGRLLVAAVSYTWKGERYTFDGWKADTYFQHSADQGKTWSKPVKVNIAPFQWAYPFGQILEETDGTLLMTCYGGSLPHTAQGENTTFVVRSKDGGKTWGDVTTIRPGYNEITMVRRKDGSLLAAMRSRVGAHLATTVSNDRGRTWSNPVKVTEDREHPADLLRLPSGHLLLTFGQRNKPFGVQAMLSRDDGATWGRTNRYLLAWDGDHSDIGYPVTVNLKNGRLATIYYVVYGDRDPEGTKGIAPKNAFCRVIVWTLGNH
ncbi:MAG: exo-alpha-sialidase [Bryobacterales bacterium]|nr:exo-alpha-sialidase [Bryobacterales bacterium]